MQPPPPTTSFFSPAPPLRPAGVPEAYPLGQPMHPPLPQYQPVQHHNGLDSSTTSGAGASGFADSAAYGRFEQLPSEYHTGAQLRVPLYAAYPHHLPSTTHEPHLAQLPHADPSFLSGAYPPPSASFAPYVQAAAPSQPDQHAFAGSRVEAGFPPTAALPGVRSPFSPDASTLALDSFTHNALNGETSAAGPSKARRRRSRSSFEAPAGNARGIGGRQSGSDEHNMAHETGGGGSASASGSASAAAAGSGGAQGESARRASVTALAAAVGTRTTEKSCKNCRVRKVKCDRKWPLCNRCRERGEECDFGTFVPVDAIPQEALSSATSKGGDVTALQARVAELERELSTLRSDPPPATASGLIHLSGPSAFPTPHTASANDTGSNGTPGLSDGVPLQSPEGYSRAGLLSLDNEAREASLSESIHAAFSRGAGLAHPGSRSTVEIFLRGVALQDPSLYAVASAGLGPLMRPGAGPSLATGLSPPAPSEQAKDWELARGAMAKMLVVHLVQAFFASCCAYLPAFDGWHTRRLWVLHNIDNLDPASRVAVAAFCALGARTSQHSAILGISINSPTPDEWFEQASAAGVRREQACRALHTQALDLAHLVGLNYDASRENLEALMVLAQLLIFNEFVPRRSRAVLISAFGMYKELQEGSLPVEAKDDTLKHIGLPLLVCDATTSAYARKKPLVTQADLAQYFPSYIPPDPYKDDIQTHLERCLRENVSDAGRLTHEGIVRCALIIHGWLAQAQRLFAQTAAPHQGGPPPSLTDDIHDVWRLLDQIHESIRKLQELLVHLDYSPTGCGSDGCADQHLRFITRLDLDLLYVFFLVHSLVTENLGLDSLVGEHAHVMFSESDKRVRKSLKLVAFYLELYITSRDPHLTYHVVWQLEILPSWTLLAVQRYGEPDGPTAPELEVSETELNWLDKGLVCASYYHPVANAWLHELRATRRPVYRVEPPLQPHALHPVPQLHPHPHPPHPPHPAPAALGLGLAAQFDPASAVAGSSFPGVDPPFQWGVTDPRASRPWGVWGGNGAVPKTG